MNRQRLVIAAAAALLASAAQAQFAQIDQSGQNDTARIDQIVTPGADASASITQSGGQDNVMYIDQFATRPGTTSIWVNQSGGLANFGTVGQYGTSGGTTLELQQVGGSGSRAEISQFDTDFTRIKAFQSAVDSTMLVQQSGASGNAYAATEQVGNALDLVSLQGQADGTVVSSSIRVFQYGDNSSAFSLQENTAQSIAYTSQGAPQEAGSYYGGAVRGWVQVEAGITAVPATNSGATLMQNGFGHMGYILQYGSFQNAYLSQSGSQNLGGILQTGSDNYASVVQSGFAGTATVSQRGNNMLANITQAGNSNTATIRQR